MARAKYLTLYQQWLHPGGGILSEKSGRVCGSLPKPITLFKTKICDIPYPIYDQTKNSKPYL